MLDPVTVGAIAGFLAARGSNALDEVLRPMSAAAGEALLEKYRVWRAGNAAQVLQEAEDIAEAAGYRLGPVPGRILIPILEQASVEDDDDLRTRWAALLANAASPTGAESVLPAFAEILRQLTSIHARILDLLYTAHGDSTSLSEKQIADSYEWRGHESTSAERIVERFGLAKEMYNVLASDLHRLQVIDGDRWGSGELHSGSGPTRYEAIHITPLGRAFVRACIPPPSIRGRVSPHR